MTPPPSFLLLCFSAGVLRDDAVACNHVIPQNYTLHPQAESKVGGGHFSAGGLAPARNNPTPLGNEQDTPGNIQVFYLKTHPGAVICQK